MKRIIKKKKKEARGQFAFETQREKYASTR